MFASI